MGLRINQNIAAMNSYRNLSNTDNQMSKSLEKLSSGFRINRAADDAAGLAISEGLRSQVGGLKVAVRNSQDGISVVQTAEGALNESHSILQRMRDLTVQASNGGGLNEDAQSAIQSEVDQLASELTRIADTTKFNGKSLLDGKYDGKFQVGANVGESIGVKIAQGMSAKDLGVDEIAVSGATGLKDFASVDGKAAVTATNGSFAAAVTFAASGTETLAGTIKIGTESFDLSTVNTLTGTAAAKATALQTALDAAFTGTVTVSAGGAIAIAGAAGNDVEYTPATGGTTQLNSVVETDGTAAVAATTGSFSATVDFEKLAGTITRGGTSFDLSTVDLSAATDDTTRAAALTTALETAFGGTGATVTAAGAVSYTAAAAGEASFSYTGATDTDKALKSIDSAIKAVSTSRADLGALQNRFDHTINNLNVTVENLSASESRIRDADMAQEMMQFTRNQILSQAGTSMLAQANQGSQGVLSLLR